MKDQRSYTGKYLELFKDFLVLADDSEACLKMVSGLLPWDDVKRVLSIGGGCGMFELSLLKKAPHSHLWYVDPSPEHCKSFNENSKKQGMLDRVKDVAQSSFQDYRTELTFDRVISSFSWFYIGAKVKWLEKLLNLITTDGVGIMLMQDDESIETIFNKMLCPDPEMALTGQQIYQALKELPCSAELHRRTKWLSEDELFDDGGLTALAKSFIAFITQKSIGEISETEWKQMRNVFDSKREERGVPLITDILFIRSL